jgi:acyl carrier protein
MTQDQFLELVGTWIRDNKHETIKVTGDTELLGSGLLDSFDFLDLIVHIENTTGVKVDLAVADPAEFSVVRGLMRLTCGGGSESPVRAVSSEGVVMSHESSPL